jgi:hypothetical protein
MYTPAFLCCFQAVEDNSYPTGLTASGLAIMVVSIGSVLTLLVWTYSKILFEKAPEDPTNDSPDSSVGGEQE